MQTDRNEHKAGGNHLVRLDLDLALVLDVAPPLLDLALALALILTESLISEGSMGGGSTPGRLLKIFFGARNVLGNCANGRSAR